MWDKKEKETKGKTRDVEEPTKDEEKGKMQGRRVRENHRMRGTGEEVKKRGRGRGRGKWIDR